MTRTILEPAGVCTEWVRIKVVRRRMSEALFCARRRAKAGENAHWRGPALPPAWVSMLA